MGTVEPTADRFSQGGAVGTSRVIETSWVLPPGGGLKHDGGHDHAPPLLIRQTDDAGLGHRLQAGEGLLNVAGLDLDPAGDDDVVQAAQDLQASIGAQPAAVGGDQDAPASAVMKPLTGVGRAV